MAGPDPFAVDQRELRNFGRRLLLLCLAIGTLLGLGTAGYALTTDYDGWESFLYALDTIATVGSLPHPDETGAQIVRVLLIVLGVGTLFYALVTVTEFFVAGHLGELLAERRMRRVIDATADHFIICGFGRVGRQVARDLRAAGVRYVVIDADPANRDLASGVDVRFIHGESSDDETLRAAGIERARAVIACVDSDAENIFTTLTARELNPGIAIVARASQEEAESKLRRAGADRVISPYKSSGAEMARLALHPQVSGRLDVDAEHRMEEIEVTEGCEAAGRTIGDVRGGAIIVGVRRPDGRFQPQPPSETVLETGDVVLALGTKRTVERLERLFDPAKVSAA